LAATAPTYSYVKEEKAEKEVKSVNSSKRRFLSAILATGLAAGHLIAQEISGKVLPKRELKRQVPIAPPGAVSFDHLRENAFPAISA